MSMGERLMARGEQAVEERRARLVAAIMRELQDNSFDIEMERDMIIIAGHGLRRRWLNDPRLRFAGRVR